MQCCLLGYILHLPQMPSGGICKSTRTHWYAYACSPWACMGTNLSSVCHMQMIGLPAWFRVLCWSELYVQLPFFFVAAYAHAYGKRWIQKPTILYGLFVSSTMVCILGELLLNTHSGHPRYLLTAFYLPYFICPFAMAMRMLSTAHPFVARNRLGDKQA